MNFFAFRIFYDHKRDRSCCPPWPSASGLGRGKAANSATKEGHNARARFVVKINFGMKTSADEKSANFRNAPKYCAGQ